MKMYMEHINITVQDVNGAVDFFKTAFPDFKIRGEGRGNYGKWIHFGTDETYIAINQSAALQNNTKDYSTTGINHVGFAIEDASGLVERMEAAGFSRSYPSQKEEFRTREYFFDNEGNEFEFVEYSSTKNSERNQYDA